MNMNLKIKAINQRYVDLKKTFGANSKAVQDYEQLMNGLHTVGKTSSGNLSIKKASQYNEKWLNSQLSAVTGNSKKAIDDEKARIRQQFNNELRSINKLYNMPTKSVYRIQYTKYKKAMDYAEKGIDLAIQDITDEESMSYYDTLNKSTRDQDMSKVSEQLRNLHDTINNNLDLIYANSQEITNKLRLKRGDNLLSMKQVADLLDLVNDGRYVWEKFDEKYKNPEDIRQYIPQESFKEVYNTWVRSREEFIDTEGITDNFKNNLLRLLYDGTIDTTIMELLGIIL